jgi:cobalt-zinc-cadmium efflux system protein
MHHGSHKLLGHSHGAACTHGAHTHAGDSPRLSRTLIAGLLINAAFVAIEFGAGIWVNSVALIADAAHNLGDVYGLVLSWAAVALAQRAPTKRHTWGLRRSSMLAALGHAVALCALALFTIWEGVERLFNPQPIHAGTVVAVAVIGIGINGLTAWMLSRHNQHDLNVRGAFLHMLADALVSVGVVIAGLLLGYTGWLWIDPLVSFLIAGIILATTWGLLVESLSLNLDGVPRQLSLDEIAATLRSLPNVIEVHDLHVWSTSTTSTALTAHLVRASGDETDSLLAEAATLLKNRFGITHSTLQIESPESAGACARCD